VDDDFLAYLQDLFSEFGAITTRAMFGGHGVYRDGVFIALVIDGALYLKVDARTRGEFEAAGCAPFEYAHKGKRLTMSYWSTPEAAMDSPQAMLPWARMAWEAALRKPQARKGRRPRSRSG
jgi:DNA transformation protein and related proteins